MLEAVNLRSLAGIRHGFFNRDGGVSDGVFASLNCGFGSGDVPENVTTNRELALRRLDLDPGSLNTCFQVHSATVVEVAAPWSRDARPEADAMVCSEPGMAIGILTADCAPVLLADAEAGIVGAAHAGWRGALSGVLENTIDAMVTRGARQTSITAAIGPCIHRESYEVGSEFRDTFIASDATHDRFFEAGERDAHFQFDLLGFVASRLEALELSSIEAVPVDTYHEENGFFSFRRATHKGETDYGRGLSMIALDGQR